MRPKWLACGWPVHPVHHPGAVAGRRLLATVRKGRGTKKKCEELARPDRKCMLRPLLGRRQLFAPARKKCEELDSRQACDLLAQGFAGQARDGVVHQEMPAGERFLPGPREPFADASETGQFLHSF